MLDGIIAANLGLSQNGRRSPDPRHLRQAQNIRMLGNNKAEKITAPGAA